MEKPHPHSCCNDTGGPYRSAMVKLSSTDSENHGTGMFKKNTFLFKPQFQLAAYALLRAGGTNFSMLCSSFITWRVTGLNGKAASDTIVLLLQRCSLWWYKSARLQRISKSNHIKCAYMHGRISLGHGAFWSFEISGRGNEAMVSIQFGWTGLVKD